MSSATPFLLLLLLPLLILTWPEGATFAAAAADGSTAAGTGNAPPVRPMSQYNKTQQERMLQMLSQWRSKVRPRADPNAMKTLVWNEELASLAQAQADRCTYEPGYPDWNETLSILSTHPNRRIGFAHWTGWNSTWATHYWNAEGQWYDYCENRCTYDRERLKAEGYYRSSVVYYFRGCVNYTQMIWGDSRHVGCGHRVCGFENSHFQPGNDHHVCYFFPGAILEFAESERMKTLPYKTQQPLAVACGAERLWANGGLRWWMTGLSILVVGCMTWMVEGDGRIVRS